MALMEHEDLIVITLIDHHRFNGLIFEQTTARKGGVGGASGPKPNQGHLPERPRSSSYLSQTEEMLFYSATLSFPAKPPLILTDLT